MDRYLICTDLDRTLIPNGPAAESAEAAPRFGRLVERPEVTLAYVSGRHRELVEEAITQYALPQPEFVVGDVGTTLYRVGAGNDWVRNAEWEASIAADWSGKTHGELAALLAEIPGLRLQEVAKQNRFKLSYYVDQDMDLDAISQSAASRLRVSGVKARLVSSHDDLSGEGLLDVLPASASKRHAIEALMEYEGFSREQTVFCGDSGNDLEVLASPVAAVLVANARDEVKRRAIELADEAGCKDRLYIARGGFLGMNGNYRGGMLEGIAHYHPEIGEWLEGLVAQPVTAGANL